MIVQLWSDKTHEVKPDISRKTFIFFKASYGSKFKFEHTQRNKNLFLILVFSLCFFSTEHSYVGLKFYYLCSLHFATEFVLDQEWPGALVTPLRLWRVSVNIHIRK